jgi:RimJ/RimL family protein N-acetyltransferase
MLDLPVANVQIDIAAQQQRMAQQGIQIVSLLDELWRAPASTLPRLYQLHTMLTRDVPLPEQPFLSYPHFARQASEFPASYFIAVDADGRYIGESVLEPGGDAGVLAQRMTGVLAEHRGRGIATALKAATVAYARHDDYHTIRTWIESTNAPMLAISQRLGFVQHPGLTIFQRATTPRRRRAAHPTAR